MKGVALIALVALMSFVGCGGGNTTIIQQSPASSTTATATTASACAFQTPQGDQTTITILTGQVSCEEALPITSTYIQQAPTKAVGSGGFLDIGNWTCHGSTSEYPVLLDCKNPSVGRFQVIAKHPRANTPPTPQSNPQPQTTTQQQAAPGRYTDCGPLSLGGPGPPIPDIQVSGVNCATAIQGLKETNGSGFPGYHFCGRQPPPNPPFHAGSVPNYSDHCSGNARILEAAE